MDKIANESELLTLDINGAYTFRRDDIGKELRKIEDILQENSNALEYAKTILRELKIEKKGEIQQGNKIM